MYFDPYNYESLLICESCFKGKFAKSPFTRHGERAIELLDLVHTNVCRPITTQARCKHSYFVTFTNDMPRFGYVCIS